jgi:hypothetical protein
MIVMPANNNAMRVGHLAGKYPGRIGHLYSPGGLRGPYDFMPFALDNGRYPAWDKGIEWNEEAFLGMLERVQESRLAPRWVLVPDRVGDRDGTLREWDAWCHRLEQFSWPLAFAAQDGMSIDDVPQEAAVVFVGGTTKWKRSTLWQWCQDFPRVHVGRINTGLWLWECHRAGAESCDGTGWLRGDPKQWADLVSYLERSSTQGPVQRGLYQIDCPRCLTTIRDTYAECPRCRHPKGQPWP